MKIGKLRLYKIETKQICENWWWPKVYCDIKIVWKVYIKYIISKKVRFINCDTAKFSIPPSCML